MSNEYTLADADPDDYPIAITLFDDTLPPEESQLNPAFEGLMNIGANNRAWVASYAAGNWNAPVQPGPSGYNNGYFAWDALAQRWLAALNESGVSVLRSTVDGGQTWNTVRFLANDPIALTTTGQAGYALLFEGGATGVVERIDIVGNTASGPTGLGGVTIAAFDYFHNQVEVGPNFVADTNLFAFAEQLDRSYVGHWYIGQDVNGYVVGGSWFDVSSSLPRPSRTRRARSAKCSWRTPRRACAPRSRGISKSSRSAA